VQILADGTVHPPQTVDSGSITLDREAERVHAGLGYETRLKTLNFTGGAPGGTPQGRIKKISRVAIRLHETLGGEVGPHDQKTEDLLYRTSNDPMGEPIPAYSGDMWTDFWQGYDEESKILFKHFDPFPATVLGFAAHVETYGME